MFEVTFAALPIWAIIGLASLAIAAIRGGDTKEAKKMRKESGEANVGPLASYFKMATGSGLTDAEKEASDLSLQNMQTLSEEDYRRKLDFYERFESPSAMISQYKSAGLNPAMMFEGGASVNASGGVGVGSAPAHSDSDASVLVGLISSLGGLSQRFEQMKQERELREYNNETQRMQVKNYGDYLAAQTEGQRIKNQWLPTLFGMQVGNASSLDDLRAAQIKVAEDALKNNEVQRRLGEAGIKESEARTRLLDAQSALTLVEKKLRETESKYYGEFLSLRNELMGLSKELGEANNSFVTKTLEDRIAIVSQTLAKLTHEANITEWQDEKKGTKMTLDYLTQVFKTLGIVGAALGGAAIRSAGAATGFMMPVLPGTLPNFNSLNSYFVDENGRPTPFV